MHQYRNSFLFSTMPNTYYTIIIVATTSLVPLRCSLIFEEYIYIFIDYAITVVPFPPLHSIASCPPPPSHLPSLEFMSMGHAYKFFGFLHYSYPPPVYFPPIIYAIYSLYLSPLSPPPNPLLITLHVISISVVLFLF